MIVVLCLSLGIDSFLSHCHLLSPLIPPALLWSELGEDSQTPGVTGDFCRAPRGFTLPHSKMAVSRGESGSAFQLGVGVCTEFGSLLSQNFKAQSQVEYSA